MDYGKLAYLKTEDLELRLGSIGKDRTDKSFARSHYEINQNINGRYNVTDIKSDGGSVCLVVKLTASCKDSGFIDVLIGEHTAARQTACGGEREYIRMIESKIDKASQLAIKADGVFVKGLELLIIGGTVAGGGKKLVGDILDTMAVVACATGDNISFFEGKESELDFSAKSRETVGKDVDIAVIGGKFYCVILDIRGNIWLFDYHSSAPYKLIGQSDGNSVCIAANSGGIIIAAEAGGCADIYDLDSPNCYSTGYRDEILKNAKALMFCKGATRPLLTARNQTSSFFLQAGQQIKTGETVEISIRATVS